MLNLCMQRKNNKSIKSILAHPLRAPSRDYTGIINCQFLWCGAVGELIWQFYCQNSNTLDPICELN